MKNLNWKAIVELVGVAAVVTSLIYVGLELRQGRAIAEADVYSALLAAQVDIDDAVRQHAGIWLRGAAGEALDEEEDLIFQSIVRDINDRMVTHYSNLQLLQRQDNATLILHDFVSFLYENPGARRVWQQREQTLNRYRDLLSPERNTLSSWQEQVAEELSILDEIGR